MNASGNANRATFEFSSILRNIFTDFQHDIWSKPPACTSQPSLYVLEKFKCSSDVVIVKILVQYHLLDQCISCLFTIKNVVFHGPKLSWHSSVGRAFVVDMIGPSFKPNQCLLASSDLRF